MLARGLNVPFFEDLCVQELPYLGTCLPLWTQLYHSMLALAAV